MTFEIGAVARRAFGRFLPADERLELALARLTGVFEKRHGSSVAHAHRGVKVEPLY